MSVALVRHDPTPGLLKAIAGFRAVDTLVRRLKLFLCPYSSPYEFNVLDRSLRHSPFPPRQSRLRVHPQLRTLHDSFASSLLELPLRAL